MLRLFMKNRSVKANFAVICKMEITRKYALCTYEMMIDFFLLQILQML